MTSPLCPCCHHALTEPLSELVPHAELQTRLHIGRDVCHRMIRAGLIPGAIAHGHTLRVVRGPFERWMAGLETVEAPAPEPARPAFLHPLQARKAG